MSTKGSDSSVKEVRELYEMKEKAAKFYSENGVPQKMEDVLNSMFYDNPSDVYGHLADFFQGYSKKPVITKVRSRPAVDSKAQTTVQTEVFCTVNNKEKLISSSVCSSANPLLLEVAKPEEREVEEKEREENVRATIKFLNSDINNRLQGLDPTDQIEADTIVSKLINDLKAADDERRAKEAEAGDNAEGENGESADKKTGSAVSKDKDKPKSGNGKKVKDKPKGKGGKGGPPVVVTPEEPRENFLCGSGCVSTISQAVCCTGASVSGTELYEFVAGLRFNETPKEYCLPLPMVTLFQSGRAAPGKAACVKEFMVVPKPGKQLKETLPQILGVYNYLLKSILNKNGVAAKNVSDIGALMVPFDRPEQGLDLIQEAITNIGLTPGDDFFIALNLAGQEIFDYEKGKYEVITGQQKVPDDMVEFWAELLGRYPAVIAIIDPLRKQEDKQWMSLCERISDRCYIIGEQVWHRPALLKDEELTENFKSSGIVYKLEHMNTVSDILVCAKKMEDAGNETVLSANIGDTTDTLLADLAVGMNARFLKIGAPCRGERISKLNRLLSIEEHLLDTGKLAYHGGFNFPVITVPPPQEAEDEGIEEDETKKDTPKKK